MIFYLTGFCWDVLSEAKNKAAITGQDVMKLMREAYEVFIFDSERAAYEPLISFYPALLVVISLLVGVLLFRFVTNKRPSTSITASALSAPISTQRVWSQA